MSTITIMGAKETEEVDLVNQINQQLESFGNSLIEVRESGTISYWFMLNGAELSFEYERVGFRGWERGALLRIALRIYDENNRMVRRSISLKRLEGSVDTYKLNIDQLVAKSKELEGLKEEAERRSKERKDACQSDEALTMELEGYCDDRLQFVVDIACTEGRTKISVQSLTKEAAKKVIQFLNELP